MNQVLEGLLRELDALDAEAQRLAVEHSAAVLATRPAQGGWSVAECWAHVAKTVEAYLPKLDQAMSTGRAAEGLYLGKVRVTSPASDKLKFPLGVGFGATGADTPGRRDKS